MPNETMSLYRDAIQKLFDWRGRMTSADASGRNEHNWNVDLITHAPAEPFHYGTSVTLSAREFVALLEVQGSIRDAFDGGYRAALFDTEGLRADEDPAGPARRVIEVLLGSSEGIHDAADAVTALQGWRDEAVRVSMREARRQQQTQVLSDLAEELLSSEERAALSDPLTDPDELRAAISDHYRDMHADNLTTARIAVESDVCRTVADTLQITPEDWRGRRVTGAELITLLRSLTTDEAAGAKTAGRRVLSTRESERRFIAIEMDVERSGDDDEPLTRAELLGRIRGKHRSTVLGWSPANHRYIEIRRAYSREHDAAQHTPEDLDDAVLALLLPAGHRVSRTDTAPDGSEHTVTRDRYQLWPFGDTARARADNASSAYDGHDQAWRRREAAALLMCSLEEGQ